jgi:hypothetical protein
MILKDENYPADHGGRIYEKIVSQDTVVCTVDLVLFLQNFISLGVAKEPNHMSAIQPGPLYTFQ